MAIERTGRASSGMRVDMNIQRIPVDKLKPAKYNPRKDLKPGDPAYEKIRRSLHDFGYVDPIIWNEVTGNIVGGHQRQKILVAEGATELDCVVVHIEDPADEKALNIALNKAVGEWEPEALVGLLEELQAAGYDLDATGFDAAEVDDLFSSVHDKNVKEDDFDLSAALEQAAFVEKGDVWQLGRHRLMCGDATSEEDALRLMNGAKANLVATDPPYGVSFESSGGLKIMNDALGGEEFYAFLLSAFRTMTKCLDKNGSAYVFHADTEGLAFRKAFIEAGFHLSGVCIWAKNAPVLGRSPFQWKHEPVLYGWLKGGTHRWYAGRGESTIWNFNKPGKNSDHPTSKPVELMAYPIGISCPVNGIVIDFFGGSGSTLMACQETDRICYMMELDPKYASVILRRYAQSYGEAGIVCERNGQQFPYGELVKEVERPEKGGAEENEEP